MLEAAQYGLNKTIKVRCKNMMSYSLSFATDRTQLAEQVPMVVLNNEPQKMPGGATIPTSLFRDPKTYEKKAGKDLKFDEATL
jgi:hypothetical protein